MDRKSWQVLVAGLWLLGGCGDDPAGNVPMTQTPPGSVSPPAGAQPDAGTTQIAPPGLTGTGGGSSLPVVTGNDAAVARADAGTNMGPAVNPTPDASMAPGGSDAGSSDAGPTGSQQPFDYMMQDVPLSSDLVIPKGKTVRVGPGAKFTAKSASIKITVQGTLVIQGSAASPASFLGSGVSESWQGIVVESGGTLTLDHAHVAHAKYGINALPGSSYTIDHGKFDVSFKGAVLQSDGTLSNSVFTAELLFPAITESVAIDDPNGFLTIINASPTVNNCRFAGSGGLNDMVRIGGNASPKFDHCHVDNSHCAFHTAGGTNTSARITNTIFENLSYGVMAYTTKPIIENSVFRRNATDIGMCSGATAANAPNLMGNSYEGGAVKLDSTCDRIGTRDPSPASAANAGAGTSGL